MPYILSIYEALSKNFFSFDMLFDKKKKEKCASRCKIWKLKEAGVREKFLAKVKQIAMEKKNSGEKGNVEQQWGCMKHCLMESADEVCGRSKGGCRHEQSRWWNEEVAKAVREKRECYAV